MNQRPNCCRPMPPQAPCPSRPPCPSCPPTQKGVLLPRILASGREWQRRACVALYVGGLPEDANGRLRLVGVTACGDADWEIAPYQEPHPCGCRGCRPSRPAPCLLRVNIPVVCQVHRFRGTCSTRSCRKERFFSCSLLETASQHRRPTGTRHLHLGFKKY